jgi:hypothetical protein
MFLHQINQFRLYTGRGYRFGQMYNTFEPRIIVRHVHKIAKGNY